jgi:hypothetical protein
MQLAGVDALLGFRVLEVELGETVGLELEVLAGVGWAYLQNERTVVLNTLRREIDDSEDWAEAILGLDAAVHLLDGALSVLLRADAGGFELGESSELAWNLQAALRWRPSEDMSLEFGYRVAEVDYARGSGRRKLALDATLHGPQFGVNVHF